MKPIPVYARALRAGVEGHLPVIDGHVAHIREAGELDGHWYVLWVPHGADDDVPSRTQRYPLDRLVPVVRRAEWKEATDG